MLPTGLQNWSMVKSLAVLVEDWGLIPSNHKAVQSCNSSPREADTLSDLGPPGMLVVHIHTCKETLIHMKLLHKPFKKMTHSIKLFWYIYYVSQRWIKMWISELHTNISLFRIRWNNMGKNYCIYINVLFPEFCFITFFPKIFVLKRKDI